MTDLVAIGSSQVIFVLIKSSTAVLAFVPIYLVRPFPATTSSLGHVVQVDFMMSYTFGKVKCDGLCHAVFYL